MEAKEKDEARRVVDEFLRLLCLEKHEEVERLREELVHAYGGPLFRVWLRSYVDQESVKLSRGGA